MRDHGELRSSFSTGALRVLPYEVCLAEVRSSRTPDRRASPLAHVRGGRTPPKRDGAERAAPVAAGGELERGRPPRSSRAQHRTKVCRGVLVGTAGRTGRMAGLGQRWGAVTGSVAEVRRRVGCGRHPLAARRTPGRNVRVGSKPSRRRPRKAVGDWWPTVRPGTRSDDPRAGAAAGAARQSTPAWPSDRSARVDHTHSARTIRCRRATRRGQSAASSRAPRWRAQPRQQARDSEAVGCAGSLCGGHPQRYRVCRMRDARPSGWNGAQHEAHGTASSPLRDGVRPCLSESPDVLAAGRRSDRTARPGREIGADSGTTRCPSASSCRWRRRQRGRSW